MSILRLLAMTLLLASSTFAADEAPATAPSVPKGEVTKHVFDPSKIFPGTMRDYWVYVPKQYDGSKPACLYVDQDNVQFKSPGVFDQLIASGEMPVTIGVYVAPGVVKAPSDAALDRYNRSYEFDGMSDEYARFLIEELLPHVIADQKLNISNDPNDRCIAGSSSGAIAAFTAAWERNDSFHRVFSAIGTYVDLRGGNIYPSLIRKFEPKTIRIFLQDGSNDNNHYGGDWWMANNEMQRALTFAGYEVNHAWGTGKHEHTQADAVFADAMRWIWKDWPAPVKTGLGSEKLKEVLVPGEGWQMVGTAGGRDDGPAANAAGEVFINDGMQTMKIGLDGKITPYAKVKTGGQAFGPDGKLYIASGSTGEILVCDGDGHTTVVTDGIKANDLVVAH
ncbi:MAG TPA: alpha/beta hydrolase-fold protein, partial [Tepidisphaeraceae bacterium]|nr:alpha/beta hydrolase-fold protein [Tepidisphaeraceae bacterium]